MEQGVEIEEVMLMILILGRPRLQYVPMLRFEQKCLKIKNKRELK